MSTPYENYPPAGQQWPGQPQQQWPGQPQQQWPGQQPAGQQWPGQSQQQWPGQPQQQWPGQQPAGQQWPGQPQQQWPGQPQQQWPGQQPAGQQWPGQQPTDPSWPGQQPGYPYGGQPTRSSRKGLWIGLAIGLVVLLAGGIGAVFLLSGPSGANTPEGAVDRYLSAAKDRDADEMLDQMCAQLRATVEKYAKSSGAGSMFGSDGTNKQLDSVSWDVTDTRINGNTATVTVKVTWTENGAKKSETSNLKVVKESGDWKVCGAST